MSNQKPSAIRICTKKSEIQDILVSSSNSSIKVLDLKGLTSAIIRPDGTLNQKFILFFDQTFGSAPITFTKFINKSLVIGMADGSVIYYEKCPNKSLIEADYKRINGNGSICSASVIQIYPVDDGDNLLVVHCRNGNYYEFIEWTMDQNSEFTFKGNRMAAHNLKQYIPISIIFDQTSRSRSQGPAKIKIAYITSNGGFYIKSLSKDRHEEEESPIFTIDSESPVILKQIDDNFTILIYSNKILVINHFKEEIISSFTIESVRSIKTLHDLTGGSAKNNKSADRSADYITPETTILELFVCSDENLIIKLSLDIVKNEIKIKTEAGTEIGFDYFSVFITPIYFILINSNGIFVHDTLTLRRINKCSFPKYFLKIAGADSANTSDANANFADRFNVKIKLIGDFKFLFIWGNNLAQIWDFNPKRIKTGGSFEKKKSEMDKGLVGNKSIRKYSKYAINSGVKDWNEERKEEDGMELFRGKINIKGLTEEEMISYAKLLSIEAGNNCEDDGIGIVNYEESELSDDSDLKLAIQLSLIEM